MADVVPTDPGDTLQHNDPNIMDDLDWNDDVGGDGDSCRICRGEATPEEPLFYPCKCSGSIKFVHQDCLMEWLSHSQKKHCELCKTSFRFTKLYSPNMPAELPGLVFVRHLIIYTAQNIATWLRFCLVVFVWLGLLPWAMRHVWTFLFWLGDGGWYAMPPMQDMDGQTNNISTQVVQQITPLTQSISPASTSLGFPINSTSTAGTVSSALENTVNTSASYGAALYQTLFSFTGLLGTNTLSNSSTHNSSSITTSGTINSTTTAPLHSYAAVCDQTSLLGDVSFLKSMTRFPWLNRNIVITLEGQIITITVVVCFILVFLIREWVVQQQPGINMGAGFNAQFDRNPRQRAEVDVRGDRPAVNERPQRLEVDRPIAIARPRRRNARNGVDAQERPNANEGILRVRNPDAVDPQTQGDAPRMTQILQRPVMPGRDAPLEPVEIQRRLLDEIRTDPNNLDVAEFVAIWRRANGRPEEVLRIIDEEGLSERFEYWKNAMISLQSSNHGGTSPVWRADARESPSHLVTPAGSTSESSTASWVDVQNAFHRSADESSSAENEPAGEGKGKGKAAPPNAPAEHESRQVESGVCHDSLPEFPLRSPRAFDFSTSGIPLELDSTSTDSFGSSVRRPRAISDGPPIRTSPSPLASNNWSFSALSERPSNAERGDSPSYHPSINDTTSISTPSVTADDGTSSQEVQSSRESGIHGGPRSPLLDTLEVYQSPEANIQLHTQQGEDEAQAAAIDDVPEPALVIDEEGDDPHPVRQPQGIWEVMADYLFGDMEPRVDAPVVDDEHVVRDINNEAPFVRVAPRANAALAANPFADDQGAGQDIEVLDAARAAGIDPNDPDGLDDIEDFDGIMELVGMRGPIMGLVQNALFSAVLISLTLSCGVWIPYNVGRLFLLLIANPIATIKLPLRLLFSLAAVLQDLTLVAAGLVCYLLLKLLLLPRLLFSWTADGPASSILSATSTSGPASECLKLAWSASERIGNGIVGVLLNMPDSEVPAFSALSHEALLQIKSVISITFHFIGSLITSMIIPPPGGFVQQSVLNFVTAKEIAGDFFKVTIAFAATLPQVLARSDSWVISLGMPAREVPVDASLSCWGGSDRFWAVFSGYVAFCFIGAAYIRKGSPFSSGQTGREWEATIIDLLNQAGGVLKVILIISIEMLVFPLYCGMLLDAALLPLFDRATMSSRLIFTIYTPLTSIFVHWFVGTCYMFHFALFVSMCRKIMRPGVLYFIRDPDDPTFHPVRDVLERNVTTQLRKITFSAMVYGALVVICLGGVVWSLALAFEGVLPIHWSSNEPVLEFPIDLLFYNFLMPLAVKVFKPADGLDAMYSWWFRKCARFLRLSWFLFDDRKKDEEGQSRKSWWNITRGMISRSKEAAGSGDDAEPPPDLLRDGRYVRAPGSDQVRLPKGSKVFLEVTEDNARTDGGEDYDEGVHGRKSDLFKLVYVPPHFRARISLFIVLIWLFAAVTGVGITILPLVFGRYIFAKIIPPYVQKNDVYAFSIGTYILGTVLYCLLHAKQGYVYARSHVTMDMNTATRAVSIVKAVGVRALRLLYFYTALMIVLPILFALTVEFYVIIPLHTYFAGTESHVIHFIQSWVLGLLYVKLSTRLILWYADSRPAEALRAVTREGYFNPDIRTATRCFIFPAVLVLTTALITPYNFANILSGYYKLNDPATLAEKTLVYRYAYPIVMSAAINTWAIWRGMTLLRGWRMRIRDEVYLIGERLHNFGDMRRPSGVGNSLVHGSNRIET